MLEHEFLFKYFKFFSIQNDKTFLHHHRHHHQFCGWLCISSATSVNGLVLILYVTSKYCVECFISQFFGGLVFRCSFRCTVWIRRSHEQPMWAEWSVMNVHSLYFLAVRVMMRIRQYDGLVCIWLRETCCTETSTNTHYLKRKAMKHFVLIINFNLHSKEYNFCFFEFENWFHILNCLSMNWFTSAVYDAVCCW